MKAATVLNESFMTVAKEFKLTKENAPTNAAFITYDKLKDSIEKGVRLFGLSIDNELIGTIGIEKAKDNNETYYLERLAVLPKNRHSGYGKRLLDFSLDKIKKSNGKKVSIGIINENHKLKKWYTDYGFCEVQIKKYDHLPFQVCFMELLL
jgi:predicted GNAT family N-acyltransferase